MSGWNPAFKLNGKRMGKPIWFRNRMQPSSPSVPISTPITCNLSPGLIEQFSSGSSKLKYPWVTRTNLKSLKYSTVSQTPLKSFGRSSILWQQFRGTWISLFFRLRVSTFSLVVNACRVRICSAPMQESLPLGLFISFCTLTSWGKVKWSTNSPSRYSTSLHTILSSIVFFPVGAVIITARIVHSIDYIRTRRFFVRRPSAWAAPSVLWFAFPRLNDPRISVETII